MKFSAREDIQAPIEQVFAVVSDFDVYERAAMRRGAEVQRVSAADVTGQGMTWNAAFDLRGRRREMVVRLDGFDPHSHVHAAAESQGVEGSFRIELLALARSKTRMSVQLEMKPRSFSARLVIQSLRLTKSRLSERFKQRVADFAKDIEERYAGSA